MATFKVTYGVGGGYNDIRTEVFKFNNVQQAEEYAYESAVDVFNSYGIFEKHDLYEDEEFTEDDYETMHQESIERWVSYSVVEVPESNESMCHQSQCHSTSPKRPQTLLY